MSACSRLLCSCREAMVHAKAMEMVMTNTAMTAWWRIWRGGGGGGRGLVMRGLVGVKEVWWSLFKKDCLDCSEGLFGRH